MKVFSNLSHIKYFFLIYNIQDLLILLISRIFFSLALLSQQLRLRQSLVLAMAARLTGLLSSAGNGYINGLAKIYGKSGSTLVNFGKNRPDTQFGNVIVATGEFLNSREQLVLGAPNEYRQVRRTFEILEHFPCFFFEPFLLFESHVFFFSFFLIFLILHHFSSDK